MRPRLRNPDRFGWAILGVALAAGTVMLLWLQRDLAFDGDSFNWISLSGLGSDKALLEPYGGHLIFLPLVVYKAVLAISGPDYGAFAVPQLALLIALSALIYEYGRRRLGPFLALPAPIVLFFLGSGWTVQLQPMIGIQFFCALVPGVAALLAMERSDRRGDLWGCGLLTLSVWSFEIGLAFIAGVGVGILLREDRWRRIWVVALPLVSYLIWKAWAQKYGGFDTELSNLLWFPAFVVDSIAVVAVSSFGLFYWVGGGQLTYLKYAQFELDRLTEGLVLLAFEALAAFFLIRWMRGRGPILATFWIALTTMLVLWLAQSLALAPIRTPGEIRYVVPSAVVLMLVLLEMLRGVPTTRFTVGIAVLITAAALIGNAARFNEGRDILVEYSPNTNAAIAVLNLGGDDIPPEFSPGVDAPGAFLPGREPFISAGLIQEMTARLGTPGFTLPELLEQDEATRHSADLVAFFGLGLQAEAAAGSSCRPSRGAEDTVTLPMGGAILAAGHASPLLIGRFGEEISIEVGNVAPGEPVALSIPPDASEVPWRVTAPGSGGLTVCKLQI